MRQVFGLLCAALSLFAGSVHADTWYAVVSKYSGSLELKDQSRYGYWKGRYRGHLFDYTKDKCDPALYGSVGPSNPSYSKNGINSMGVNSQGFCHISMSVSNSERTFDISADFRVQTFSCPGNQKINKETGSCEEAPPETCSSGKTYSSAFVYDPAAGYQCVPEGDLLCRAECGSVCVNRTGESTWGPLETTGVECAPGDPGDLGEIGGGDTGGGDTGGGDGGDTGGDGGDTGGGDSGGSGGDSGGSGGDSGGSGGDSGGSGGDSGGSGGDTGGGDNPNQGGSDNSDLIDESGMPSGADYVGNMDSNKKGYGDALDDIDGSSGVGSIETFADESGIYGAISGVASIFSNSQCSNPKYSGSIQVEMDVCGAASKVRPFAYIMFAVMAALYCYQRINATFREV